MRKFLLRLLMISTVGAAQVEAVEIMMATPAGDVRAGESIASGRLVTVTSSLPAKATFWFVITPDVDFKIINGELLLATPCQSGDVVILLAGVNNDADGNPVNAGQKKVVLSVVHDGPEPHPPTPPVNPVVPIPTRPPPSPELQSLVAPIKSKLSTDPAKAAAVAWCFAGFADAIRGVAGERIATVGLFGQINSAALSDFQMRNGVTIGAEVEAVLATHANVTKTDRPLSAADRMKIAEVLDAVSWAGGR